MSTLFDTLTEEQVASVSAFIKEELEKILPELTARALRKVSMKSSKKIVKEDADEEEESKTSGMKLLPSKKVAPKDKGKVVPLKEEEKPSSEGEDKGKEKVTGNLVLLKYYSDKAHVLFGSDTTKYKEDLIALGLRYGKYGGTPGWMFPAVYYEATKKKLNNKKIFFEEQDNMTKKEALSTPVKETPVKDVVPEPKTKSVKSVEKVKEVAKPKEESPKGKLRVKNNQWKNLEETETGFIFMKTGEGTRVVGYQDKKSKASGLDSILPLTKEMKKTCKEKGWTPDDSILEKHKKAEEKEEPEEESESNASDDEATEED